MPDLSQEEREALGMKVTPFEREAEAQRAEVARLTEALAKPGKTLVGNEAGRYVAERLRDMAENNPEFRDGLLEIARDLATVSAGSDEEIAYQKGRAEVTVEPGRTVTADVVLEHDLEVKGRIVDDAGKPVPGAVILVGEGAEGQVSIEQSGEEEQLTTDDDGRFTVRCAAGPRALLALSPTSPSPLVVHFFVAQPGQDVDLGELVATQEGGPMMRREEVEVAP